MSFGSAPFGAPYFAQGPYLVVVSFGTAEPDVICYALPDVGRVRVPPDVGPVVSARDARVRAMADASVVDVQPDVEKVDPS